MLTGCLTAQTAKQKEALVDLSLGAPFTSNMVLQRGEGTRIWGWAEPATEVEIRLEKQTVRCQANEQGYWIGAFEKLEAGGPYDLVVKAGGANTKLTNVLIGDVWLASGQSNMEWLLRKAARGEDEIAAATYPEIRLLKIANQTSHEPQSHLEISTRWEVCSPESAPDFSAVAYFFGREIHQEVKVPIGLIDSCIGGTSIFAGDVRGRTGLEGGRELAGSQTA